MVLTLHFVDGSLSKMHSNVPVYAFFLKFVCLDLQGHKHMIILTYGCFQLMLMCDDWFDLIKANNFML